jgi:serine/threonine protein kinase
MLPAMLHFSALGNTSQTNMGTDKLDSPSEATREFVDGQNDQQQQQREQAHRHSNGKPCFFPNHLAHSVDMLTKMQIEGKTIGNSFQSIRQENPLPASPRDAGQQIHMDVKEFVSDVPSTDFRGARTSFDSLRSRPPDESSVVGLVNSITGMNFSMLPLTHSQDAASVFARSLVNNNEFAAWWRRAKPGLDRTVGTAVTCCVAHNTSKQGIDCVSPKSVEAPVKPTLEQTQELLASFAAATQSLVTAVQELSAVLDACFLATRPNETSKNVSVSPLSHGFLRRSVVTPGVSACDARAAFMNSNGQAFEATPCEMEAEVAAAKKRRTSTVEIVEVPLEDGPVGSPHATSPTTSPHKHRLPQPSTASRASPNKSPIIIPTSSVAATPPLLSFDPAFGQSITDFSPARGQGTESVGSTALEPVLQTRDLVCDEDEVGMKRLNNEYVFLATIGEGMCGKVKLAHCESRGGVVAVKIVRRGSVHAEALRALGMTEGASELALRQEIAVMKKLRHKNIVALYEVIDDPRAAKMYLVMQYVDGGSIGAVQPDGTAVPIEPNRLADIARQAATGLHYLHTHGVVHRDVKPENVLHDSNGCVYLADFGVAGKIGDAGKRMGASVVQATLDDNVGTPLFMPPELLKQRSGLAMRSAVLTTFHMTNHQMLRAGDLWSLGVTLFVLYTGNLPFPSVNDVITYGDGDGKLPAVVPAHIDGSVYAGGIDIPTAAASDQALVSLQAKVNLQLFNVRHAWEAMIVSLLDRDPARRPSAHAVRLEMKKIQQLCVSVQGPLAELQHMVDMTLEDSGLDDVDGMSANEIQCEPGVLDVSSGDILCALTEVADSAEPPAVSDRDQHAATTFPQVRHPSPPLSPVPRTGCPRRYPEVTQTACTKQA